MAGIDASRLASETVPVEDALNRVTAEPVFAKISSPHYHAAAMDGICVRAEDTFGATEFVGKKLTRALKDVSGSGVFAYVDTGNSLPAWANAVIMIEKVRQLDDETVEIFESVAPWNHVRLVGEDVVATELLLPRSHRLRPYDLGALLASGHTSVRVKVHPKVGIIPTGDELIQPGEEAKPGAVIEFNSTVLAAFVREWGGVPVKYSKVKDDAELLEQALGRAADECDVATIIAGSSAGEHDLTADVVAATGELWAHGIDVMPGKPAVLGAAAWQAGHRLSRISSVGDRHRAGDLETRVGKVSWLRGAVLSPSSCRGAEKTRVASRPRGIYPRNLGTRWRKIGRRTVGSRRWRDYNNGARRWIITYPQLYRRFECGRGNRGGIAAARRGNRKYHPLHG